jgi:hypothetical protein
VFIMAHAILAISGGLLGCLIGHQIALVPGIDGRLNCQRIRSRRKVRAAWVAASAMEWATDASPPFALELETTRSGKR